MAFETLTALRNRMIELGAERMFFKVLAENDNSKQQIYLGGSFDVLQTIPHGDIRACPGNERPNYKAPVDLSWIDAEGRVEVASGAQLILYPDYPEVRLSGFLRGCSIAPSHLMRSLPRRAGRVLFLGIVPSGRVLAYAADENSSLAMEARALHDGTSLFTDIPKTTSAMSDARRDLLDRLWSIHSKGWFDGFRLDAERRVRSCNAPNCGGYTLEASFDIVPNGRAEPDFRGWELKAHSGGGRITLMTPEPTIGHYRDDGVEAFVRRFGRQVNDREWYFTGQHTVGVECATTRMTMRMVGYDPVRHPLGEVGGSLQLCTSAGEVAAGWAFSDLLAHWSRKHANTAFVPYESRGTAPRQYLFGDRIRLGMGANFANYLAALATGIVKYDPGPKVTYDERGRSRVKARSQFRTTFSRLGSLYAAIEDVCLPVQ